MVDLPRLAVTALDTETPNPWMVWALAEAFRRVGVRVQRFLPRADFCGSRHAILGPGERPRHLDSWLMTPDACRALFIHGSQAADLAVVEGTVPQSGGGGAIAPLCEWLDLPRLIVLDVRRLRRCCLPDLPADAAGLLLDNVRDAAECAQVATNLEALLRLPVLGALEAMPELRNAVSALPRGERVPHAVIRPLGERFSRWWKPHRILQIASRRPLPAPAANWLPGGFSRQRKLTVAIAYDNAFHCYFPDTLDLLEWQGASVIDFSPLRDEHLPPQADVLVFGCGCPDRHAVQLSENHCMMAALRSHVRAGRRVYAEGGGIAYLCQAMELYPGEFRRMAGILPGVARRLRRPFVAAAPAEIRITRPIWLGPAGTVLRGYSNPHWQFQLYGAAPQDVPENTLDCPILGDFQVVGCPLHLHFAANPCFFEHFFCPEQNNAGSPDPFAVRVR